MAVKWSQLSGLLGRCSSSRWSEQRSSPSALWFPFAEKDVNRTDRTNRFYEGIDNPGLVLLHDILMTYCMYDFDLGERKLLVTNKLALLDPPAGQIGPSRASAY